MNNKRKKKDRHSWNGITYKNMSFFPGLSRFLIYPVSAVGL
jgi:hypothetical protein